MTWVPDRLRRLLDPATIAVVGGAKEAGAIAQCDRLGYAGNVWPVHPTRRQIGGRRAVAAVDVLPGAPDAALVAVDRHRTIDVVAALRAVGAGGVVCFASGFAEVRREGALLQERLRVAAGDMPLLGPNCHGFVNALSGAALWPDAQGCLRVGRGVAVVTQSGNLALSITMRRRGPPVAQVITVGNQAGVRLEDCVAVLASDPRITAIGLHVEQLTDPVAFGRAAIRAWDHHTPIVVLQTGVSTEGAVLARTHTASLTGRTATYRSLFARYDVAVVHSAPAFVGALFLQIVLAVKLEWLPLFGMTSDNYESLSLFGKALDILWHAALPIACFTYGSLAYYSRFIRANMQEVIRQDYIRTARAKGLKPMRVLFGHAMRNGMIPVVTVLALDFGFLFSGALVTETIFAYPGMGKLIYDAIMGNDYNLAMIALLFATLVTLAGSLLADIAYVCLDRRITFRDLDR